MTNPITPVNCILNITIADRVSLMRCWIPFFKNGGLFIPSVNNLQLDSKVFVLLKIFDDEDESKVWPVYCKVALTKSEPMHGRNSRKSVGRSSVEPVQGVGLQIITSEAPLLERLTGMAESDLGRNNSEDGSGSEDKNKIKNKSRPDNRNCQTGSVLW